MEATFEHYDPEQHGYIIGDYWQYFKTVFWCGIFVIFLGLVCVALYVSGIEIEGESAPIWFLYMGLGFLILGFFFIWLYYKISRSGRESDKLIEKIYSGELHGKVTTATITHVNELPSTLGIIIAGFSNNQGFAVNFKYVNENRDEVIATKRIRISVTESIAKGDVAHIVVTPCENTFLLAAV